MIQSRSRSRSRRPGRSGLFEAQQPISPGPFKKRSVSRPWCLVMYEARPSCSSWESLKSILAIEPQSRPRCGKSQTLSPYAARDFCGLNRAGIRSVDSRLARRACFLLRADGRGRHDLNYLGYEKARETNPLRGNWVPSSGCFFQAASTTIGR
jgi:hypothetical protein